PAALRALHSSPTRRSSDLSMLGALIALVKTLADPYTQLPAITFWLLGSFSSITVSDLALLSGFALLGIAPLAMMRWRADAMALSDRKSTRLNSSHVKISYA